MGTLYVMGKAGDTRIAWDKARNEEVTVAERTFNDFIGKGYRAFRVSRAGQKGEAISRFDKNAEEILFITPIAGG